MYGTFCDTRKTTDVYAGASPFFGVKIYPQMSLIADMNLGHHRKKNTTVLDIRFTYSAKIYSTVSQNVLMTQFLRGKSSNKSLYFYQHTGNSLKTVWESSENLTNV